MRAVGLLCWIGVLVCAVGAALADGSPVGAWIASAAWFGISCVVIGAVYAEYR